MFSTPYPRRPVPGAFYSALACIILFIVACPPALAARQVLIASVTSDFSDGPDATLLKTLARKMNQEVFFQNAPFKRRLIMMGNGDIDLICGLLKQPEREAYISYITPPYKTRSDTVFFVPKGQAGRIRSYGDLKRLKIGTVLGARYFPRFDNDIFLDKDPVHKDSVNFKKLIYRHIDAFISVEFIGIYLIYKAGLQDQLEMADFRFHQQRNVYIGLSKKSRLMADITQIETTVRQMIQSGEIRQIYTDYFKSRRLPVPAM